LLARPVIPLFMLAIIAVLRIMAIIDDHHQLAMLPRVARIRAGCTSNESREPRHRSGNGRVQQPCKRSLFRCPTSLPKDNVRAYIKHTKNLAPEMPSLPCNFGDRRAGLGLAQSCGDLLVASLDLDSFTRRISC
jgi:hypothetical protein